MKHHQMNGYAHGGYADSLAEFGTPRELPLCGGWILERSIPGSSHRDAMGCYPLFVCRDWTRLRADMDALQEDLVCLSMVTDPFGNYVPELLRSCFDLVIPFKEHFVRDLEKPLKLSKHHRRYTRRSLEKISIDMTEEPIRFIDEWTELYGALAKRFNVTGIRAFSRVSFAKQLSLPGAVMFRALYQGNAVGAHLLFSHNEFCYGHLSGVNSTGQELMASYPMYQAEMDYFTQTKRWIDWGGGVGVRNDGNDGLTQFKRGWSTDLRTSYFCGRIFDRGKYEKITQAKGISTTDYFPAYRKGEFG